MPLRRAPRTLLMSEFQHALQSLPCEPLPRCLSLFLCSPWSSASRMSHFFPRLPPVGFLAPLRFASLQKSPPFRLLRFASALRVRPPPSLA